MTIDEIKKQVNKIEEIKWDDEVAHINEDALREEFISYIASTYEGKLADMAKEVLKTNDIDFPDIVHS